MLEKKLLAGRVKSCFAFFFSDGFLTTGTVVAAALEIMLWLLLTNLLLHLSNEECTPVKDSKIFGSFEIRLPLSN